MPRLFLSSRPLIHACDIAQVAVNNLESPAVGIYNLATSNLQIKSLAEKIGGLLGSQICYTEQKFEDQRNYAASFAKAVQAGIFDLERPHDVECGVREISNLIKSGRVKYVDNDIYSNERHLASLFKNGQYI